MKDIAEPGLDFFCNLQVQLGAPIEMGATSAGRRRIIPIIGGTVSGPHFEGRILNLGADWQTQFHGGTAHLDTRYALETLDGATIEIINRGFRHGPPDVIAALQVALGTGRATTAPDQTDTAKIRRNGGINPSVEYS